jgi:hypothetical protein
MWAFLNMPKIAGAYLSARALVGQLRGSGALKWKDDTAHLAAILLHHIRQFYRGVYA